MSYYRSSHWTKLRKVALQAAGYRCSNCGILALGRQRNGVSPVVDHIKPRPHVPHPTSYDTPANLAVLCLACHNKKTAWVDQNDRDEIGADGFPVGSGWG